MGRFMEGSITLQAQQYEVAERITSMLKERELFEDLNVELNNENSIESIVYKLQRRGTLSPAHFIFGNYYFHKLSSLPEISAQVNRETRIVPITEASQRTPYWNAFLSIPYRSTRLNAVCLRFDETGKIIERDPISKAWNDRGVDFDSRALPAIYFSDLKNEDLVTGADFQPLFEKMLDVYKIFR